MSNAVQDGRLDVLFLTFRHTSQQMFLSCQDSLERSGLAPNTGHGLCLRARTVQHVVSAPSSSPCFTFDLGPSSTVSGAHWLQPKDAAASLSRGGPGGSSHVGDPNRREPALSLPLPYDALPVAGNCSSLCVPAASTRSPATARGTVCRCVSFLPADRPLLAGATRTFPRSAQWSSRHVDLLSHTECMNE